MHKRHINFIIPVWGSEYVNTFIKFCLPSLASGNNLQLLKPSDGHKLYICTTAEGEKIIGSSRIFSYVRSFINVEFINIDHIFLTVTGSGKSHREDVNYQRMTAAHNLAIMQSDRKSACSYLMPDNIVFDGFIAKLLEYLNKNRSVLMYSIAIDLSETEKKLTEYINDAGLIEMDSKSLCDLAINNLHHSTACSFTDSEHFLPNGNLHFRSGDNSALLRLSYLHPILVIPENIMPLIPEGTTFDDGSYFEDAVAVEAVAYPADSNELIMFALDRTSQKSYLKQVKVNRLNLLELAVRICNIEERYLNNLKRVFLFNPDVVEEKLIKESGEIVSILFKFMDLRKHFEEYVDFYKVKMAVLYSEKPEEFAELFNKKIYSFLDEFRQYSMQHLSSGYAEYYENIFAAIRKLADELTEKNGKLDILEYIRNVLCLIGSIPGREPDMDSIPYLDTDIIRGRLRQLRTILNADAESYFYGGGDESKIYISMLYDAADRVKAVIDDSPDKAGTCYKGVKYIPFMEQDFADNSKVQIIIMSPNYDEVIYQKLRNLSKLKNIDIYRWGGENAWELN